jgi:hypothetical protein
VTAGKSCATGTLRESDFAKVPLVDFCKRVADVYEIIESTYGIPRTSYLGPKWVDEYVGLSYDAISIFDITVADHGGTDSVNRRKVRDAIRGATFEGATSPEWDYKNDQIPRTKLLMILAVDLGWRELPDPTSLDTWPCRYVSYREAGNEKGARKFEPCSDFVVQLIGGR